MALNWGAHRPRRHSLFKGMLETLTFYTETQIRSQFVRSVFRSSCFVFLPDPGSSNACMRTFPDETTTTNTIFRWFTKFTRCYVLDMGFGTLDLKCCELNLRELTVRASFRPQVGSTRPLDAGPFLDLGRIGRGKNHFRGRLRRVRVLGRCLEEASPASRRGRDRRSCCQNRGAASFLYA